jgi:hypothetical protein
MNLFSQMRTRLGHFILSHVLTKEVIESFVPHGSSTATSWPTQQFFPAHNESSERHTEGLSEKDVEVALREHRESREVPGLQPGGKLPVNLEEFRGPGSFARWYYHRESVEQQDTVEISAIELQEELLKRLGEGECSQ